MSSRTLVLDTEHINLWESLVGHEAMLEWFRLHGLDPHNVDRHARVERQDGWYVLVVEEYVLDAHGKRQANESFTEAIKREVRVPLDLPLPEGLGRWE